MLSLYLCLVFLFLLFMLIFVLKWNDCDTSSFPVGIIEAFLIWISRLCNDPFFETTYERVIIQCWLGVACISMKPQNILFLRPKIGSLQFDHLSDWSYQMLLWPSPSWLCDWQGSRSDEFWSPKAVRETHLVWRLWGFSTKEGPTSFEATYQILHQETRHCP